jgi:hypothetical protein
VKVAASSTLSIRALDMILETEVPTESYCTLKLVNSVFRKIRRSKIRALAINDARRSQKYKKPKVLYYQFF